ncbi:MAG TPA: class I SAM-dependent methyltransferase [Candidatus Binatia bacterium]|nr:class I SAM-dependent methyltransferase [Candidatus Binatia bacterium]
MSDRQASRTAFGTACIRAVHQLFDAEPRILDDPIAPRLLGPDTLRQINDPSSRYRHPRAAALRAHVVLRSRFAEDRLAAAVLRGVTQYVVLGAGFDTFALRQPAWARTLKILEVDHPATQAAKRARIAAAGLVVPPNVDFAQIDFERESLRDGLQRYGVAADRRTFFSWLGVTMYLKEDAIDAVLDSVATFPSGSEIVLTFAQPPEDDAGHRSALAQRVAAAGEPFVSHFEPRAIEAKLHDAGFATVEFLSPSDADARYFRQRPDDLPVPVRIGIVSAVR